MESRFLQPLASVTVTRYKVLAVGEATGFAMSESLSVLPGDHWYCVPPLDVNWVLVNGQIILFGLCTILGSGNTVTVRIKVSRQPSLVVTISETVLVPGVV